MPPDPEETFTPTEVEDTEEDDFPEFYKMGDEAPEDAEPIEEPPPSPPDDEVPSDDFPEPDPGE